MGASLLCTAAAAEPQSCFPTKENVEAVGRAYVYAQRSDEEPSRYMTQVVAASSAAGGVVMCEFRGRPKRLAKKPSRRWETDANGRSVADSGSGLITKVNNLPECSMGLGPCVRRLDTRIGEIVEEVERRCENGFYVEDILRFAPGGLSGARIKIARRYDESGVLIEIIDQRNGRAKHFRLISTEAWNGEGCVDR